MTLPSEIDAVLASTVVAAGAFGAGALGAVVGVVAVAVHPARDAATRKVSASARGSFVFIVRLLS
jgi:hypothetical protein